MSNTVIYRQFGIERGSNIMKGIILAGGSGTRLYPATKALVKQLLPVYDKPMIYYPLSTLMLAGIRDILIISTPEDLPAFERLFDTGEKLGLNITYAQQRITRGLADDFLIGENFIGNDSVCLVLGDNLFYGQNLTANLQSAVQELDGAVVFGYPVNNPSAFGVCEFDENGNVISIEEKPQMPKSKYAVPGLYFYNNDVIEIAKKLKPSNRGELEITDINNEYIKHNRLKVKLFGRGMAWFDTGSPGSLHEAGEFVGMIQEKQGYYISCIEEIAWRRHFIDDAQFWALGKELQNSEYGKYILRLAGDES